MSIDWAQQYTALQRAEQRRLEQRALAGQRWDTWRAACCWLLEKRHGCAGVGCEDARHVADVAWLRTVAEALGFDGERPGRTRAPG